MNDLINHFNAESYIDNADFVYNTSSGPLRKAHQMDITSLAILQGGNTILLAETSTYFHFIIKILCLVMIVIVAILLRKQSLNSINNVIQAMKMMPRSFIEQRKSMCRQFIKDFRVLLEYESMNDPNPLK